MCTVSTSAIACQILFCIDSYLCLYLLLSFHVFDKLVKNCNHKVSTWAGYSQIFSMCTSECTSDITNEKCCICYCTWIRICLCTFAVFLARVLASHVVLPTRLLLIYLLPSTVTRPQTFTNYIETICLWGKRTSLMINWSKRVSSILTSCLWQLLLCFKCHSFKLATCKIIGNLPISLLLLGGIKS